MSDKPNSAPFCPKGNQATFLQANSLILELEIPDIEEIAKAIWQRQHDALVSETIAYNAKWRDQSIPSRYWDEFLLDAHAVLLFLYDKHIEYQNARL